MRRHKWIDEITPIQEENDGQVITRIYHRPTKSKTEVWIVKLTDGEGELISANNITPKPAVKKQGRNK